MIIGLIFIALLLISALTVSVSANLRFGNMLMNVEDNLQTCVDIVDKRYYNLMHVFDDSPGTVADDPLVRSFLKEVHATRNDMLMIANLISRSTEQLNDISSENETPAQNDKSVSVTQAEAKKV